MFKQKHATQRQHTTKQILMLKTKSKIPANPCLLFGSMDNFL